MSAPILDLRPDCLENPTRFDLVPVECVMLLLDQGAHDAAMALILQAKPINQLQDQMKGTPFGNGVKAGKYLLDVIGMNQLSGQVSAKKLAPNAVCWGFEPYFGETTYGSFLTHIWPRYRSVAHFWAAWLYLGAETSNPAFPCTYVDLPRFLGLSEGFRLLGHRTRAFRAPNPVLPNEAEMVKVPILQGFSPIYPQFVMA
jgi:hypothetical protein